MLLEPKGLYSRRDEGQRVDILVDFLETLDEPRRSMERDLAVLGRQ